MLETIYDEMLDPCVPGNSRLDRATQRSGSGVNVATSAGLSTARNEGYSPVSAACLVKGIVSGAAYKMRTFIDTAMPNPGIGLRT